uniref:Uncharacterized protein n=1 Tax=viral metagenome TaxID=1070528 RepID=A0A6M3KWA9_9ZZZZ
MRVLNIEDRCKAVSAGIEAWKKEIIKRSVDCEPFVHSALLEAQHRQDIKDFIVMLESGHSVDYIMECLKQLVG